MRGPHGMPRSGARTAVTLLVLACAATTVSAQEDTMDLPDPLLDGATSVEATIANRRSVRELGPGIDLGDIGQLLWAAQGVTEPMPEPDGWRWGEWQHGLRAAPSAGALYPLELYLVAAEVDGLDPGLYHYHPAGHALTRIGDADRRALASAALGQRAIAEAPAIVLVTGVYRRTAAKYGDRAERYVHMEVGAAAENLYLQAEALELGTVFIGAFRDDRVARTLGLPEDHAPLAIMPVGRPR